jgi:hypothetical protein
MANFKSPECQPTTGYRPPITPAEAGQICAVRGQATLPNTLAANDIVELVPLPPGCVPVDVIVDADDLDTNGTPTITLTAAVINAAGDDIVANTEFFTASTVAQAGGVARMDKKTAPRIASSTSKRNVGLKVVAAAATKAAGVVGMTLFYRSRAYGE